MRADVGVRLRAVLDSDLGALYENQRDVEAAAVAGVEIRELDDFLAHRARIAANPEVVSRAIVTADGELVGDISSWREDNGDRMVGYRIARAHWGRGIATAALSAFLTEVTERPLYAEVGSQNVGSRRVLEKCGFALVPADRMPVDAAADDQLLELT